MCLCGYCVLVLPLVCVRKYCYGYKLVAVALVFIGLCAVVLFLFAFKQNKKRTKLFTCSYRFRTNKIFCEKCSWICTLNSNVTHFLFHSSLFYQNLLERYGYFKSKIVLVHFLTGIVQCIHMKNFKFDQKLLSLVFLFMHCSFSKCLF